MPSSNKISKKIPLTPVEGASMASPSNPPTPPQYTLIPIVLASLSIAGVYMMNKEIKKIKMLCRKQNNNNDVEVLKKSLGTRFDSMNSQLKQITKMYEESRGIQHKMGEDIFKLGNLVMSMRAGDQNEEEEVEHVKVKVKEPSTTTTQQPDKKNTLTLEEDSGGDDDDDDDVITTKPVIQPRQ